VDGGIRMTAHEPRVLAINGSPHREGNTAKVMRWVADGCEAAGAVVDWFDAQSAEIDYCLGCNACLRTGQCVQDDSFAELYERIQVADGLIVGSPVYEGQMTAQLKTIADRLALLTLYAGVLQDHWTVGVATSGVAPARPLARQLADLFGQRSGFVGLRTASLRAGQLPPSVAAGVRGIERAKAMGRRLVRDIENGRTIPPMKAVWIRLLRRRLLPRLVMKTPGEFAAVIEIWRDRGWL